MNILLLALMLIHSPGQAMPTVVETNGNTMQMHQPGQPMPTTITVRRRNTPDPDVTSISSMGFGMSAKSNFEDPSRCKTTKKKCNRCNGRWQLKKNCEKCKYTGVITIKKWLNPKTGKFDLDADPLKK